MSSASSVPQGSSPFPSLAQAAEDWTGLPVSLEVLPGQAEVSDLMLPDASISLVCSGSGQRWMKSGARTWTGRSVPGLVDILPAGTYVDRAWWAGTPGEVILLKLPAARVERLAGALPLQIQQRHELFDPSLAQLLTALWKEAAQGASAGTLYTQGLSLALLGWLDSRYGDASSNASRPVGRFTPQATSRLRRAIEERLDTDLRIDRMAEWVAMSPTHFARMFKATFGQSPHAFVLDRRIEAACRLLKTDQDRPIADIALALGFASQAHFTDAFRRKLGTTPARWRRGE